MIAKTICRLCKKEVTEDCKGCIGGNILVHNCKFEKDGSPIVQRNINWKVLEK